MNSVIVEEVKMMVEAVKDAAEDDKARDERAAKRRNLKQTILSSAPRGRERAVLWNFLTRTGKFPNLLKLSDAQFTARLKKAVDLGHLASYKRGTGLVFTTLDEAEKRQQYFDAQRAFEKSWNDRIYQVAQDLGFEVNTPMPYGSKGKVMIRLEDLEAIASR